MKIILALTLIMNVATAASERFISRIEAVETSGKFDRVTFQGDSRVYQINRDHPQRPCLRSAWLAQMAVDLRWDPQTGQILDCRLYSGPPPGMEAQESPAR